MFPPDPFDPIIVLIALAFTVFAFKVDTTSVAIAPLQVSSLRNQLRTNNGASLNRQAIATVQGMKNFTEFSF